MTADHSAEQDLLARIEAATGPDREMDAYITEWAGEAPEGWRLIRQDKPGVHKMEAGCWISPTGGRIRTPKPLTASIDAALALVERVLPGWGWQLDYPAKGGRRKPPAQFTLWEPGQSTVTHGNGATPALAILAALLRSRHPSNEVK